MLKHLMSVAALTLFVQSAYAENYCKDVLQYASRNYTLEIQQNSIAKRTYDQSCNGSQSKESSSLSIGLDAIVESIPIKFNLGSGSNREKLQQFCKTFDESYKSDASLYDSKNLVSSEGVKAWSDCLRLYDEGVVFNPMISPSIVTIEVTKKTADPVKITGIQYDPAKMKCSVPDDEKANGHTGASMATQKILNNGDTWAVACDRTALKSADHNFYPEQDLAVHTTKGTLQITIPGDAVIGVQTASVLNEKIDKLGGQLLVVGARKPQLECKSHKQGTSQTQNPDAVATIPPEDGTGWTVTGGGCETSFGGHWPPVSFSGPKSNSAWECIGRDPPGIPLAFSITATVIYCRVGQ